MTVPLPRGSTGLRVLLVEHDPAMATAIRAALAGARSEVVHVAASADEAASARRQLAPDVVLWDTRLRFGRSVSRPPDQTDVPVVPLLVDSAAPMDPDDGRFGHVSWPCPPEHAVDTLRQATCHHARARADALQLQAAGMAHDVHTLLTVVNGCVGLALEDQNVAPGTRRLLAEVLATGERATTLTKQLLTMDKALTPAPSRIDLATALRRSEGLLQRLVGDRIELRLEYPPSPAVVVADPSRLERLFSNLAANARDAMPEGGVLTMSVSTGGGEGTPIALLRVRDSGAGIAPAMHSRMFEPFVTSKPAGGGTGLGLAIVDDIIRQLGGAIRVESTPGHGTTFEVHLPMTHSERSPTQASGDNDGVTVLLVEDEDALRDLLATALRLNGYHVIEAKRSAEALARFEGARRVRLMVTDVSIADGQGPELAAALQARDAELKVLYISGRFPEACGVPADRWFLQKPFPLATLVQRVQELLAS